MCRDGTRWIRTAVRIAFVIACLFAWGAPHVYSAAPASSSSAISPAIRQPESATTPGTPSLTDDGTVDDATDDAGGVDDLLDLDLDQLSEAPVTVNNDMTATLTDPVVESVSKTPEKASDAPGIVDVITAEEIEAYGAKNLYEVLERATSVYMTGSFMHRRNTASIRGNLIKHEDNHVLILINGRPFRDSTLGGVNHTIYTAFPIQTIERIEVLRGPGSVLYGTNAFTGVINIVTKKPNGQTHHASALAGSDNYQSYSLAGGQGDGADGLYVGATYSSQTGWPFTATLEDSITDTGLYGEDNVGVFGSYHRGGFSANVFAAYAQQEIVGTQPTWPLYESVDPRVFVDLGYLWDFDDYQSIQFNFTYNYDGYDTPSFHSTPGNIVPFKSPSNGYLVEATYRAKLTERLDFMLGALADIHQGEAASGATQSIPRFTETWYGVYMQFDYRPTEWLKLVGGMQGNMPGEVNGGIVPRAGAIASLTDEITFKFLYGQAFRSPYQIERSIDVGPVLQGNPNLTPETIQTFDVQLAYHTEDFRLAATWFHSDFFGVVTRVGTLPQSYVNQGCIEYDGFELENDWALSDRWRWVGSMTYQENVRDGVENTTSVPNWMAKMGIAYDNKDNGLRIGLFDTFYGRPTVPATATDVNPAPREYHLVSLNTTLDFNRFLNYDRIHSLRGQFLIQNLFDEPINQIEFERELLNSLPAGAGRTYYGGFVVEF